MPLYRIELGFKSEHGISYDTYRINEKDAVSAHQRALTKFRKNTRPLLYDIKRTVIEREEEYDTGYDNGYDDGYETGYNNREYVKKWCTKAHTETR